MGREYPDLSSYTAGQLSPLLDGQTNLDQYGTAASELTNFIPTVQGPLVRRSGSAHISRTRTDGARTWLIPFTFSTDQSFVLEFGDRYIRFYKNQAPVLVSGVTAWSALTNYVIGDLVSVGPVNYYCILAHINQLPPNATYWYALTGAIYEIPTPYLVADLTNTRDGTLGLDYRQSGDVTWLWHGSYQERKLIRLGDTQWVLLPNRTTDGPFVGVSLTETTTVYASAETGAVTLTASTAIFQAQHVGTLFLLQQKLTDAVTQWETAKAVGAGSERRAGLNVYATTAGGTTGTVTPTHTEGTKQDGDTGVAWTYLHSGYGVVEILTVAGLTATANVLRRLPSQTVGAGNPTTRWSFSSWDAVQGYPTSGEFFRHRLVRGRGVNLWMSVPDDFDNMAARDAGLVLDSSAIFKPIASDQVNAILWLAEADRLIAGTSAGEFSIGEITSSLVLSNSNCNALPQTRHGSRAVNPVATSSSLLFSSLSGRKMFDLEYTIESEAYESTDLTVLAENLPYGQMIQSQVQEEPHKVIWCVCADGSLVTITYSKEQKVLAWSRQVIAGMALPSAGLDPFLVDNGFLESDVFVVAACLVESVAVIPSSDGAADEVWLQLFYEGATPLGMDVRHVVVVKPDYDPRRLGEYRTGAFFVDDGLSFDFTGTTGGMTLSLGAAANWLNGGLTGDTYQLDSALPAFAAGDVGDFIELKAFENNPTGQIRLKIISYVTTQRVTVKSDRTVPVRFQAAPIGAPLWAFCRSTLSIPLFTNEPVAVFADGDALDFSVVSNLGVLSFQRNDAQCWVVKGCVGWAYVSSFRSMRLNPTAGPTGTSQGRIKRVDRAIVRLKDAVGGYVGPSPYGYPEAINYGDPRDPLIPSIPPRTGDFVVPFPSGYDGDAYIYARQALPLPMTIVAILPRMDTGQ